MLINSSSLKCGAYLRAAHIGGGSYRVIGGGAYSSKYDKGEPMRFQAYISSLVQF